MTSQIFISYSKKDKDFAWKLADDLLIAGHKVWIDRSLQVGEDWKQTIEKKLEEADEVIVILSSNATASKWVQHEGSIAYGLKKQMYPVLIEELPVEELPIWMSDFQYHSFVNVDYEPAFEALNAVLTPPNPIQDLLEQQVSAYRQTGNLMGSAILQVIEEARDTLEVDETAEELIEKSKQALRADQQRELDQQRKLEKTRQQRTIVLTVGLIIALILSVFSFSLYRTSNRNLENANSASTQVVAERDVARVAREEAESALKETELQRALAEEQSRLAFARQLANQAASFRTVDYQLALLLGIESINTTYEPDGIVTLEAETILRGLLSESFEPVILETTEKKVSQLVISPNEKYLCVLFEDQTIHIWNMARVEPVQGLPGTPGEIKSVMFSTDSNYLIVSEASGTITVRDLEGNMDISRFQNSSDANLLAINEPKSRVAVYGSNRTINIWDWGLGELVASKAARSAPLEFLYSPNGESAVVFSDDGTVEIWDIENDDASWVVESAESMVSHVMVDPAWKTILIIKNNGTAIEWDMGSRTVRKTLSEANIFQGVYTQAGLRVLTAHEDGTTNLWDVDNNKILATLTEREILGMQPYLIDTNHDGSILIVAREAGHADIWRTDTGGQISSLTGYEGTILLSEISPSGRFIVTVHEDGKIRQWDTIAEPDRLPLKGLSTSVWRTAFDKSGKYIAAAGQEGVAIVWDAATGEVVSRMEGHEISEQGAAGINNFSFDPAGKRLVTAGWDKTARVWDVLTGEPLFILQHTDVVTDAIYDPSGTYLATSDFTGVYLWDPLDGSQIIKWDIPIGGVNRLAFSNNGTFLAAAGTASTSWVWNVTSKQEVAQLQMNGSGTYIQFNPDDSQLTSVGFDGIAHIWDTKNWSELAILPGLSDTMWDFAYSPDGSQLVTGGDDGKVRVWEPKTGNLLMEFQGHPSRIWSIAYSPRGNIFATGGEDGTVRLWNAKTGFALAILPDIIGVKSLFNLNIGESNFNESFTLESGTITFSSDDRGVSVLSSDKELKLPWIMAVNFDPTGRYIAAASTDGTVNIYIAGVDALLNLTRLRLQRDLTCFERVQFLYEDLECDAIATATPTSDSIP